MRIIKMMTLLVLFSSSILQINPQSAMAQNAIGHSREPNHVILEYTLIMNEIADPNPIPLMRVFGDGTVNVHFPVYMKRAGDYYLQLSDQELTQLVSFLDENGLFDFDTPKIRQLRTENLKKLQAELSQNDSRSVLFKTQDADISVFIYNVERYVTDSNGSTRVMPRQGKIAWRGLKTDAARFSNIREITGLAAIEKRLKRIIDRDDLIKIED